MRGYYSVRLRDPAAAWLRLTMTSMSQRPGRSIALPLAIAIAVACALGFLVLGGLVVAHGPGPVLFDVPVRAFVQGLGVPQDAWEFLSWCGGQFLVFVDVLVVALLLGRRQFAMALLFAAVLIAVTLGVDAIKDLVARPRPADPLVPAYGYSFPSGHAFTSTVSFGLLGIVAWRSDLPLGARRLIAAGAAVMALVIGCSRVGLGVHYPTDVSAGWLGGSAVLLGMVAMTAVWWARPRVAPASATVP